MLGSMPPKYEVREVLNTPEKAGLESLPPIYDDGRMIVEEGHLALKDEMKFSTRKYLAPYGLQEVELQQEGRKLVDAPNGGATNRDISSGTTRELLQDLSGDNWANTATPPLGSLRKNLELPLASETWEWCF